MLLPVYNLGSLCCLFSHSLCSSYAYPTTILLHKYLCFDGHILCSQSPLVSVGLPAMVLFITVSSLPWALRAPWACPPVMTRCGLALEVCANRKQVGNLR